MLIGVGSFYGCNSLSQVELISGLTVVGEKMFYLATGISSITIPSTVTSIGRDYCYYYYYYYY